MNSFNGFPEGKTRLTTIPEQFFYELLPVIDDLGELKITLYTFWRLDHMEGVFRYLREDAFFNDERFLEGMGKTREEAGRRIKESLKRVEKRGILLKATVPLEEGELNLYFLNSPKGRAAIEAIARGNWRHSGEAQAPIELTEQKPNIYSLYEEHIGPLTPMIADALRKAEESYPAEWTEEAIRIAVENNARSWRYVSAILDRWQVEGRHEQKDRRDTEEDRRRYVEGEFADYIEH